MTKHPHAELMAQYAQDALETDKPWERWQLRNSVAEHWEDCEGDPRWLNSFVYRRKPETESDAPAKYTHRFTCFYEGGSAEEESLLNATHISIYKVNKEGREEWIHDIPLPQALLDIFDAHQTAVELYNQLLGLTK